MAGRLRVAELEAVPQRARLVVGEREQLGHRVALDVRGAEEVLDRELPAGEVALEREVGDAHRRMMRHHAAPWQRPIVIVGVPTALGGHLSGMELTPAGLRALGPGRAARGPARVCAGVDGARRRRPARSSPGSVPDPDPRAKNRARICEFLPRERDLVATALGGGRRRRRAC